MIDLVRTLVTLSTYLSQHIRRKAAARPEISLLAAAASS